METQEFESVYIQAGYLAAPYRQAANGPAGLDIDPSSPFYSPSLEQMAQTHSPFEGFRPNQLGANSSSLFTQDEKSLPLFGSAFFCDEPEVEEAYRWIQESANAGTCFDSDDDEVSEEVEDRLDRICAKLEKMPPKVLRQALDQMECHCCDEHQESMVHIEEHCYREACQGSNLKREEGLVERLYRTASVVAEDGAKEGQGKHFTTPLH